MTMKQTSNYWALIAITLLGGTFSNVFAQTITHDPLYTFQAEIQGDEFGWSVSGAGDVNADGVGDFIVGAPNPIRGRYARVLSGSDGSVLYNFEGESSITNFGYSVSGAGDVNGDGNSDLIVGSLTSGVARVFSGSDGSVLYNFEESTSFGFSVSGAGDVNGDGRADLIVGAPLDDNGDGSARVLSGLDGSVLYNFRGDEEGNHRFGTSVSSAGDVNQDGKADLIVGSLREARVFSGSDGSVLYNFDGEYSLDNFGQSVSSAGDVNGDGIGDFIVGAPESFLGRARVLSGSDGSILHEFLLAQPPIGDSQFGASVSSAGDVNGDGMADLIVGARLDGFRSGRVQVFSGSDGSVLYDFTGDRLNRFGASVSGVGDVNGDGIDDFIIGAPGNAATTLGYAQVFVSRIAILGDCNQDGVVNFLDISPFITILSTGEYLAEADTNGDRVADFLDISPFISLLSF